MALAGAQRASWKEGAAWFTEDSMQGQLFREIWVYSRQGASESQCGPHSPLVPVSLSAGKRWGPPQVGQLSLWGRGDAGHSSPAKEQLWDEPGYYHPKAWLRRPALLPAWCTWQSDTDFITPLDTSVQNRDSDPFLSCGGPQQCHRRGQIVGCAPFLF